MEAIVVNGVLTGSYGSPVDNTTFIVRKQKNITWKESQNQDKMIAEDPELKKLLHKIKEFLL